MVERPADVLPMDKMNPPRFDWFTRADMALRRVPGLGFLIAVFMLDTLYTQGRTLLFLVFAVGFGGTLLNEFISTPEQKSQRRSSV
jgi:hypothetical protein